MKTGCIYMLRNLVTGEGYIGKDSYYPKRPNKHLAGLTPECKKVHRSIKKYGVKSFVFGVIEDNILNDELNVREIYWVDYYDTFYNGLNLTMGGDGPVKGQGNPMDSEEARQKHSERMKRNNPMKDPEQRRRMRENNPVNRLNRHPRGMLGKSTAELRGGKTNRDYRVKESSDLQLRLFDE